MGRLLAAFFTRPRRHVALSPRPARASRRAALAGLAVLASATTAARAQEAPTSDELYEQARELFEQLPAAVKSQFDFPSRAQWDAFGTRLQRTLEGSSLEDLAALSSDARSALTTLRLIPGYVDLADWLEQRLDEIEGAGQATQPPRATPPGTPARFQPVPHYDLWLARVRDRAPPARAAALLPRLRAAFVAEGVPPELVWLAEAESSFNPAARSPVGAKGLFQFMPETAKAHGLSTTLPDERTDPDKSARAAARYLRQLHGRFGNWALALAAYNAGEGRVRRTLDARRAKTFTAIADALPAETRMYVPKVCALVATRTGLTPERIPAPKPPASKSSAR